MRYFRFIWTLTIERETDNEEGEENVTNWIKVVAVIAAGLIVGGLIVYKLFIDR